MQTFGVSPPCTPSALSIFVMLVSATDQSPVEQHKKHKKQDLLLVSVDFSRFLLVSVGLCCFLVSLVSLGSRAQRTRAIMRTHNLEGAAAFLSHAPERKAPVVRSSFFCPACGGLGVG